MKEETEHQPMKPSLTPQEELNLHRRMCGSKPDDKCTPAQTNECCATCRLCQWSMTMATHYCAADGIDSGMMPIAKIFQKHAESCRKRHEYVKGVHKAGSDTGQESTSEIGPFAGFEVEK